MTDHHDALDRYLDDLANGKTVTRSTIEPELMETIRQVAEIGSTPLPDTTFIDQLEDTLMNALATAPALPRRTARPGTPLPRALPIPNRLSTPIVKSRRWFSTLASAALLLLTIGIAGYATLDRNDSGGPGGPAIQAPATPSPAATDDSVLLEFPLPAEALPAEGFGDIGLRYFTMAPNSTATWDATPTGASPGMWANYVVSGSMTLAAEGEVMVIRGSGAGSSETVPAGTEITLKAGDGAVHDIMESASWTSTGADEVEIISLHLQDSQHFDFPTPTGWTQVRIHSFYPAPVPNGDWIVRLEVLELEPDEMIPAPAGDSQQSAVTAPDSDAYMARGSDGQFTLRGATTTTTVYVFTLEQTGGGAATPEA